MNIDETMESPTYRIIFWGEVARGYPREQVKAAFARRFNIESRRRIERIFSGRVLALKHHLTVTEAHRYISAIQQVGGICRMEREEDVPVLAAEMMVAAPSD